MRLLTTLLLLGLLIACESPSDPAGTGGDSLQIELPASAVAGDPISITLVAGEVLVGSQATLRVSAGQVDPDTVTLSDRRSSVEVVITGAAGTVVVTAQAGAVSAEGTIRSLGVRSFDGPANDPIASRTPRIPYQTRAEDYSEDHPDAPGMTVSHNTLIVLPAPATTVGQINAILAKLGGIVVASLPGQAGVAAGPLGVRIPAAAHSDISRIADSLRQNPLIVAAAPDVAIGPTLEPPGNQGTPSDWTWDDPGANGNWGMELIRAPQMWNLNRALEKRQGRVDTGIIDSGFANAHNDLTLFNFSAEVDTHGTHVAGIIGAKWKNGIGVEGVNPFAQISTVVYDYGLVQRVAGRAAWLSIFMGEIDTLIEGIPGLRLINMSLGYNWGSPCRNCPAVDTNASVFARTVASNHGLILDAYLRLLAFEGTVPTLIVASGNDSNKRVGLQDARWASPMCNAALEHGNPDIIVVEAIDNAPGSTGGGSRSPFSNPGGHVSAPGSDILSTVPPNNYFKSQGTSMATPHVTGLAGYLLALDPSLSSQDLLQLLLSSSVEVDDGASNRIDAFGAVLSLDGFRGQDRVLRMLCDFDDGSADGNTRVDLKSGIEVSAEDLDGHGGEGDGNVDMSDFRRFRDALLQVEAASGLMLDGRPDHPKRDLDGNQAVDPPAAEATFSRFDLNGDGVLDRDATAPMILGFPGQYTDLEVLQSQFVDPDYPAGALPGLLDSADLHVLATRCFEESEVVEMRSRVEGPLGIVDQRLHNATQPLHIYTVAAPGSDYTIIVEAIDANGAVVATSEEAVTPAAGEDLLYEPECLLQQVHVEVSLAEFIAEGASAPLVLRAGTIRPDRSVRFEEGISIEITVAGGSVGSSGGFTDLDGFFSTTATMGTGSTLLSVFATATDLASGHSGVASAFARVPGGANVRIVQGVARVGANASATAGDDRDSDGSSDQADLLEASNFDGAPSAGATASNPQQSEDDWVASGSANAHLNISILKNGDDRMQAATMSASATADASSSGFASASGSGQAFVDMQFEVIGERIEVILGATGSTDGDASLTVALVGSGVSINGPGEHTAVLRPGIYRLFWELVAHGASNFTGLPAPTGAASLSLDVAFRSVDSGNQ